jgi:SAM-dependent methyltransferase
VKVCLLCKQQFDSGDWHCPRCGYAPPQHGRFVQLAADLAQTGEGFSRDHFAELFQLENRSYWFRSRNRLLIWALRSYFPNASRLLEIGCGTGFVLWGFQQAFPHLQLHGGELFNEGLVFADQRLPGVTLLQMDARCIPYEMEFDVIGAFDMLEHVQEDEMVLSQMFHATRPGGGILVTVPQHPELWSVVDEQAFHKRRYSQRELVGKVERVGFHVMRTTSFVSLLLPLLLVSRLHRHITRANFNPLAEYNVSEALNEWLERVLDCERVAIGRGVSFPAGGSLLLIATRERQ